MPGRGHLLDPEALLGGPLFHDMLRTRFGCEGLHADQRIGAYRIVRELGRGGMGVVYLAERADGEFDQQVALKWLPDAGMSPESALLFRRERQFLAALSHPNIAQLFDGGHSADGHLWFAMEYVEGLPIDRHAQAHALDERARVALLLPVLEAVEFAHGRLLIHRDIKPGNVLIDLGGRPRLLDFGIAGLAQEAEHAHAFTPECASPEQRALLPVGTASDVWQLGTLLEKVLRIDAERPVARDLKAIIAVATAEAPGDRYRTVTDLKHDLMRWLECKPVRARGSGGCYRLQRLVERHPLGALVSLVATIALTSLVIAFLWYAASERVRLRQARDETIAINKFLTDDVLGASDPFTGNGDTRPLPNILEDSLGSAERRFHDHPSIAGQIDVALGYSLLSRGRYAASEQAADRALALLNQADGALARTTAEARLLRARVDMSMGQPKAARARLDALQADFPYATTAPSSLEWRIQDARGWNQMLLDDYDACMAIYARILDHPHGIDDTGRSDAYNSLSACQASAGQFAQALDSAREAERLAIRSSGRRSGNALLARIRIAFALSGLGRHEEATRRLEREVDALVNLLGETHGTTATYLDHLGAMYLCANDAAKAAEWTGRGLRARRAAFGEHHPWTIGVEGQYVIALIRAGRAEEAAALVPELEKQQPLVGDLGSRVLVLRALAEWSLWQRQAEQALSYYDSARHLADTPQTRTRLRLREIEAGIVVSLLDAGRKADARAALARYAAPSGDRNRCTSPLTLAADHALRQARNSAGAWDAATALH